MNSPTVIDNKALIVEFTLRDADNALKQLANTSDRLHADKAGSHRHEIIRLMNFKTNIEKYIEPIKTSPDTVTNDQLLQVERETSNALRYIGFLDLPPS